MSSLKLLKRQVILNNLHLTGRYARTKRSSRVRTGQLVRRVVPDQCRMQITCDQKFFTTFCYYHVYANCHRYLFMSMTEKLVSSFIGLYVFQSFYRLTITTLICAKLFFKKGNTFSSTVCNTFIKMNSGKIIQIFKISGERRVRKFRFRCLIKKIYFY